MKIALKKLIILSLLFSPLVTYAKNYNKASKHTNQNESTEDLESRINDMRSEVSAAEKELNSLTTKIYELKRSLVQAEANLEIKKRNSVQKNLVDHPIATQPSQNTNKVNAKTVR